MASKKRKTSHNRPLASSRPPGWRVASLSSQASRALIRNHHVLQKRLAQAEKDQDRSLASSLRDEIQSIGGIQMYQQASLQGQSAERGGDSSRILMSWFQGQSKKSRTLRLLEVGALNVENACSRSGTFQVERIDLHSQHADILEQDFMKRPLPTKATLPAEGFDLISLSLVVNYVSDPQTRGEMLKRTTKLLRFRSSATPSRIQGKETFAEDSLPGLFLVLPSSCVQNSRYLNEEKLEQIMTSLGYILLQRKLSAKLIYQYWKFDEANMKKVEFGKDVIRNGASRNNFAIVLHWKDEQAMHCVVSR